MEKLIDSILNEARDIMEKEVREKFKGNRNVTEKDIDEFIKDLEKMSDYDDDFNIGALCYNNNLDLQEYKVMTIIELFKQIVAKNLTFICNGGLEGLTLIEFLRNLVN